MNRFVVGTWIAAGILAGCAAAGQGAGPTQGPASGPADAFGGTVKFQLDGAPATTEVTGVGTAASASGTAVTSFGGATHTVRLECASRDGDTWALGGKSEQTTVGGERAGDWSAVIVKDGSPQQIGIWLSAELSAGSDCKAFLDSTDFATIDLENFNPVESGALVPPPGLAP